MRIRGLSVSFPNGDRLFNGLDLDLPRGSLTLVCGSTGSGKSTLALALAGSPRVSWTGSVEGGPAAVVWQDPGAQMCGRSLLDEVRLPMDYACVPADEADRRARGLIRRVGLARLSEDTDPMRLSGGEQQRLSLAAALAQDAPVLVLDETTSQLDPDGRRVFMRVLDEAAAGRTIIAVDHNPEPYLGRCNRVIILGAKGRVVFDGPGLPDNAAQLGVRAPGHRLTVPAPGSAPTTCPPSSPDLGLGLGRLPYGAIVALTGPNGAGKSTLLRSLARRRDLLRAGISWLPQRGSNHLLARTVGDELSRNTAFTPASTGLEDSTGLSPLALSGGQRQRLALARALGRAGTRLALLDEPSYSQDLSGTAQVAEMIKQDAHRRVTLMATHDSLLIDALATHVLRLPGGRIEEAGPQ